MKRYRIIQTRLLSESQDQELLFNFKDNSGYHNFADKDLHILGWVFNKTINIDSLNIYLFSGGKKLFKKVTRFLPSPRLKEQFSNYPAEKARIKVTITYKEISPLLSGNDFSLYLVANMGNKEQNLAVLCFVEDYDVSKAIFVVGSPRSGTSILGIALRKALVYECFAENHLIPLLHDLLPNAQKYFAQSPAVQIEAMMLSQLDDYLIKAQLQNIIKNYYKEFFGSKGFVDKTPGIAMIKAIKYIREMWPQAKFIFAKRRGIENVSSRLKKFPNVDFQNHCQEWRHTLEYWYNFKDQLPPKKYLEVDQYDVQMRSAEVAAIISNFLHLTSEQTVTLQNTLTTAQPEKTRESVMEKAKSIFDRGWTSEQIKQFRAICGNAMSRFGYSENEQYYLEDKK